MAEDLLTILEAMYHSGDVSEFISARMPPEKLLTGWIEKGLLRKGFSGKIQDKANQEGLVIPTDRFARLIKDLDGAKDSILGFLILGGRGLNKPKFCALVFKPSAERGEQLTSVSFWTRELNTKDISNMLARHLFSKDLPGKNPEVNLDYLEQLKNDVATGVVQSLLSLEIVSDNTKIDHWIRDTIKNVSSSERVISHSGNLINLSKIGLLFSRWLISLELFRKSRNNLAAIFVMFDDRIDTCLWDTNQNIATFASLHGIPLEDAVDRYLSSLWAGPDDIGFRKTKTPQVVIGDTLEDESISPKLDRKKDETTINESLINMLHRVEELESKVLQLSSVSKKEVDNLEQSSTILQSRINQVLDRLESLAEQLQDLESRLQNVQKGVK